MGHKVHPKIHRTPVIFPWDSRWFSKKDYALYAEQDFAIRTYLKKQCKDSMIDSISVERGPKNLTVTILAGKPGFIIGRSGEGLEKIRKYIETRILKMKLKVKLNIREVSSPALSANIIAQSVANDIERRIPFRRSMKQSIERTMMAGAKGVKIRLAGRLNGVEIARSETLSQGKVPLITLRSDVDYGTVRANTLYGVIGIKVWVYHGEVFGKKDKFEIAKNAPERKRTKRRR